MVRPPPDHPDAERGDLGTVHVDAGRSGAPHGFAADHIDERLLEEAHERLHLDAAAPEIDERIEHDLSRSMVSDLAAAIGRDHRDAVRYGDRRRALSERVDRRMLEQPELVRAAVVAAAREAAHRFEGRRVFDAPQALDDDVGNDRHSTITTAGWSQSSW